VITRYHKDYNPPPKKIEIMSYLKRMLSYTKPYWKTLTFSMICTVFYGLAAAIPTYILKHTIDEVFIKSYNNLILPFVLLFLVIFALKGLFAYLSAYYMHWVSNKVVNDIRQELLGKIIYFPTSFFQKYSTGSLMSSFLNDVQMIQMAATATVRNGIRSVFEALFLLGFALMQNFTLGLLMLIVGPPLGYIVKKLGKARKNASTSIQEEMGKISMILQEIFVGVREIKAFNAEGKELMRFKQNLSCCFDAIIKSVQVESLLPGIVETLSMVGCGAIFYVAAHQVLDGTITAGQLTSFIAAVVLAYQPLKKIVNIYSEVQYGLAAAQRIFLLMDHVYPSTQNRQKELLLFSSSISCNNLSFSYSKNISVMKNVTLTIKKGESVGIIGPSGSGKSTLCDMLLGFINPTEGQLLIDGVDVSTISLQSLRNKIGYVGQRTFLFNDTIFNNIAYSKPNATREDVIAAAKTALAHDFIMKLTHGYDSYVGEDGNQLSGGQKQRLTIARALLKNPEILIFDEATSALDEESEQMIRLAIDQIRQKKTLIIVSHRPTMLQNVDRMLIIEAKTIREMSPQQVTKQLNFAQIS